MPVRNVASVRRHHGQTLAGARRRDSAQARLQRGGWNLKGLYEGGRTARGAREGRQAAVLLGAEDQVVAEGQRGR